MVTQDKVHQVFFFSTSICRDVPEEQVLAQIFHFQAHELGPLEGRFLQQLASGASSEVFLQDRTEGTKILLALATHVLRNGMEDKHTREASTALQQPVSKPPPESHHETLDQNQ